MMKINKLLGWAFMALATITSCSEDTDVLTQESEIKLTSEITPSRVTALEYQSTQIVAGQQVGVTIIGATTSHNNVVWNVGENGALINTGDKVYYGAGDATITAYHPYNSAWTSTSHSFSVNTDQSSEENYRNSDLLWATAASSKTENAVPLEFTHKLAKINVTLDPEENTMDLSGATISICNTKISTTFNPTTGVISDASGDPKEIKAGVTSAEAYTASAIVVPQTVNSGSQFIKIALGEKIFYYTLSANKELKSGYSHNYTLTVKEQKVEVRGESEIADWTDESNVGDAEEFNETLLLPDGSTFNSIVAQFLEANTGLTKIKFVANSNTTSESILVTDEDGTKGYLVANGECLEIHTAANSFIGNSDCSNMFSGYNGNSYTPLDNRITSIELGTCFKTSQVTNMSNMFSECSVLTSLDVQHFNTENVTNMGSMFYYCPKLASLEVGNFNTTNVTDMNNMFSYCSKLTTLDVANFETSNVLDMSDMFERCSNLTSLDISNFDTRNVTNMSRMFYDCSLLPLLDVSNLKTENVTDMGYMFYNCSALTLLDVSEFNTSNVTNMMYMFNGCSSLTSLDTSNFDTGKVTSFTGLFSGCSNLNAVDVSGFNTTNATGMSSMFSGCSKLSVIDVSKFNTSNVSGMGGMFDGCSSLSGLDLLNFTFGKYPNVSDMLNLTGSTAGSRPILVKVTKEGYIYLTQVTSNCDINQEYAKFVNEDGSDCVYEEDVRVYNSSTTAVQPELVDNVYLIQSAANLKWFMENCDNVSYKSAHYKLTTDIVSYNISWDPVWFSGIFDGGNHSIANLKFYGYEDCAYGFFAYMSGTVKNLVLINPTISQTGDNDSYGMNSGLLAAQASGLIINCGIIGGSVSVSSTSKAWANGGGMVGNLVSGALMKGCYVIGTTIKGDHTRNGTYVGGLIGESYSGHKTITSCYTKDIIISGNNGCNIGTFIGHTKSSSISITTCYYDSHTDAIGNSYNPENIMMSTFQELTDENFTQAITQMNANLTDCDYIFGEDGLFVKRQ